MSDLIDRQAALDVFKNLIDIGGIFTEEPLIGAALIAVREAIAQLPTAEPKRGEWVPVTERLPEVSYDILGNWCSEEVILLMNDEEFTDIRNGHFNPIGVFEVNEHDGPAIVGQPGRDVIAWMPLPEPWRGDNDE